MPRKLTLDLDALPATLPDELVAHALRIATDDQWASERGRRTSAARKTRSGGRNGGRPKKARLNEPAQLSRRSTASRAPLGNDA